MTPQQILAAMVKTEKPIQTAFLEYVRTLVGSASMAAIQRLVTSGQVVQIAETLGVTEAALGDMLEQIRNAYMAGGKLEADNMPTLRRPDGTRVRQRFDIRNFRAESWLREHSATLVQDIVTEQREAIRNVVEAGVREGRGPRQIATDIIGPIGPNGRRSGGIVGLNQQQARFVVNAREELLSGDPARLRAYLGRVRRDKRFDPVVNKAIRTGKPLTMDQVNKITERYADRLLQLRAENIARTEALSSFSAAREQAYLQAIDEGTLDPQDLIKTWRTSGRANVRETHRAMGGQKRKMAEPFVSPSGARLMHPGDTSLGAGAGEIVNCACQSTYKIDFIAQGRRRGGQV